MCKITQSFVDEGRIIGYIEARREEGDTEDEITEKIKKKYNLNEFQAETFIEGTKTAFVYA